MKTFPAYGLLLLAMALLMVSASCTQTKALTAINVDKDGLAIKGYDPVAYFTRSAPVKGSAEYSYEWKGAMWRFASAEHLELFRADPERYAPQYGGY